MEIRIGIVNAPRELAFETSQAATEVTETIEKAISEGTPVVRLADERGRAYLVPTAGIAYVEVGSDAARRVGFVA